MKTLLTLVLTLAMQSIASGQGGNDLKLRYCLEGRATDRWTPLRASEDGVVICATAGEDTKSSKVVTIIGDVLDTISVYGRQLTQGVLVDSVIIFCVYRSDSSIAEYNLQTKDILFYHHDRSNVGRLPLVISSFGSDLVALDLLRGPMIVNREQRSLEMVFSDWIAYTAYEVFGVRDSIFVLGFPESYTVSVATSERASKYLCPPVAPERTKVSIIGSSARWMDWYYTVWSFSRTTGTLDSIAIFSDDEVNYNNMSAVGMNGVLMTHRSEVDSSNDSLTVSYYSFDKSIVRHYQILVCGGRNCHKEFDGIGWSDGIFYVTVGSPDSMMCIYSYKEPEPVSSSVELDVIDAKASKETSVAMSLQEFDAWRRGLTSSHEMYDLYGNNITTSDVGVGVVFVIFDDHCARVLVTP